MRSAETDRDNLNPVTKRGHGGLRDFGRHFSRRQFRSLSISNASEHLLIVKKISGRVAPDLGVERCCVNRTDRLIALLQDHGAGAFTRRRVGAICLGLAIASVVGCEDDSSPPAPRAISAIAAGNVKRLDAAFDMIVPVDARVERVATGFRFIEGPIWRIDSQPHLLFSDLRGNALYRWNRGGELVVVLAPFSSVVGPSNVGPNGLTLDRHGRLVICESGDRRITRVDDGRRIVLADRYQGKRLNSPNDLVYRSDGSLYFTDPPYGLAKQDRDPDKELSVNGIYRLAPDGSLHLLDGRQYRPNGIAFSPDEGTLYVANSESERNFVLAYPVESDGRLGPERVFFEFPSERIPNRPDGIKVDAIGNVYVAATHGVWVLDRLGKPLGVITPDERPANIAWGDDGRTLYIAASTSLYRIALLVPGVRPEPWS